MNNKYIKFNGKFRDLIPMGFKFQKMFARNYRCYVWHPEGQEHYDDAHFWLWQHLGGYLEIANMHSASWIALKLIEKENYNEYLHYDYAIYDVDNSAFLTKEEQFYYRDTNSYIETKEGISYFSDKEAWQKIMDDKDLVENYSKEYKQKYVRFTLNPEMIEMLKLLVSKKLIYIEDDNRKRL